MKRKIALLTCVALLLCAGCGQKVDIKLKDGKEVVASIDGYDITAEDLYGEMKNHYGTTLTINLIDEFIANKEVETTDELTKKAKEEVQNMKSYYEGYGYKWDEVLTQYGYTDEQDLIEDYVLSLKKEQVAKNYLLSNVTEDEIKAYYDAEIYGDFTVKHILVIPDTTSEMTEDEVKKAETEAYNTAKSIIEKLDSGASWSELVKQYSEDTASVSDDGKIVFTKGDVVNEFFEASKNLKDGEYSKEPVESTYGYHIINRISLSEKPALDKVKEDVKSKIVENKLTNDTTLSTTVWTDIRAKYNLNIADTKISDTYKNSTK